MDDFKVGAPCNVHAVAEVQAFKGGSLCSCAIWVAQPHQGRGAEPHLGYGPTGRVTTIAKQLVAK